MSTEGVIYRVAGPVVTATGISPRMYDVVHVGNEQLMGEVIKIIGDYSIIQVYEDTSGIKPPFTTESRGPCPSSGRKWETSSTVESPHLDWITT